MTTINTTDDLLSLLNENKEFREAARHAILTEELLALPATYNAFVSEMREFVSEIRNYTKATDRRLQALEEGQQEIKEDVRGLAKGQQEIKKDVRGHTDDLGELKGIGLETKLYNRGPSLIATLLKVRGSERVRVAETDANSAEFNSAIYEAQDDGLITDDEYERILNSTLYKSWTEYESRVS